MAESVVDRIDAWLKQQTDTWVPGTGVLKWASDYGDDIRRAWLECPRADYLMALAGVLDAPRLPIQRAVAAAGREALVHVPSKVHQARKAVHYAESYQRADRPSWPKATEFAKAAYDAMGDVDAQTARIEKVLTAAKRDAEKVWCDSVAQVHGEYVAHAGLRSTGGNARPTPSQLADAFVRMTNAIQDVRKEPGSRRLKACMADHHLFHRRTHAVNAASNCASATDAIRIYDACVAETRAVGDPRKLPPEKLGWFVETLAKQRQTGAWVITFGARAFTYAAEAFAHAAAASEEAFASETQARMTLAWWAVSGMPLEDMTRDARTLHGSDSHADAARAAKLLEFANRVRAMIPLSELDLPGDPSRGPSQRYRTTLRHFLVTRGAVLRTHGFADVADLYDMAIAMIDTEGPLPRETFAPMLRTIHEQTARVYRQRAAETSGEAQALNLLGAEAAEAEVRYLDRVLDGIEREESNWD